MGRSWPSLSLDAAIRSPWSPRRRTPRGIARARLLGRNSSTTRTGCARRRRSSRRADRRAAVDRAELAPAAARPRRGAHRSRASRSAPAPIRARGWCWRFLETSDRAAASACSITAAAPVYWRSPPPSSAQRTSTRVDIDPQAVGDRGRQRARQRRRRSNAALPDALAAAALRHRGVEHPRPAADRARAAARARAAGAHRALRHPRRRRRTRWRAPTQPWFEMTVGGERGAAGRCWKACAR